MKTFRIAASAAITALVLHQNSFANQTSSEEELGTLRAEIELLKKTYENRIATLEAKLEQVAAENKKTTQLVTQTSTATTQIVSTSTPKKLPQPAPSTPATNRRDIFDNRFNPATGILLNGKYSNYSSDTSEIAGFAVGEEGERGKEGFAVDHTELNFAANVDDKFFGSMTAAIAEHEGNTEVELEEAYAQTLPGAGLPDGMRIKAGRAFWTLGYLNEHHSHIDDFADRPLPYRVFLNEGYNDDGAEISYVLPTDFYFEVGGGAFRGDDFPFGSNSGEGIGAWSAFSRIGNDIGYNQSWRVGAYALSGEAQGTRSSNETNVNFTGDTQLYATDFRYTWAPTGNPRMQELILQGEYFLRQEDGTYEDTEANTGAIHLDDHSTGWYAQGVYKFHPQWRIGARYSELEAANTPAGLAGSALDANGHDPYTYTAMVDWTNSEFSRLRLQYNYEELSQNQEDNQIMLQYIMSIGAHAAHKY